MIRRPGDAQFTAFVQDAWRPLYRSAYLLLGEHGAAEDLAQAALTKTYAAWGRVREPDAAYGYARTVLLNEARSLFRRTSWRRELPSDDLPEQTHEPDPSDRPAVLDALRLLPPRQRAVIVLRFYEDLDVERTADTLGCSPGTVKSQTSAALSKLRRLLGDAVLPEGALHD
ncbi:RNA polymerase sigma-70 factor, sigma-E family [Nocardioides terrae]|uniref:RNA polymerase sigma-70 factor, sigma-E family n=1 Tax=Nocardioides terrae TaxID=574651 RepID=A0A1I1IU58_9ACTN|nr:SigE family RNA polymerase sigma factor [Nocardioides terrae]SFC39451.1 RNA polymerase sigma-70 factor, sigma-E family [Nocardioides terrae]